jgi:hypothetical protein
MDIKEITISDTALDDLVTRIEAAGASLRDITIRVYPTLGRVSFDVNRTGMGLTCGEVTNVIRA